MILKHSTAIFLLSSLLNFAIAEDSNNSQKVIGGPLGTKPIQLSIDSKGIKRKDGGHICDIDTTFGGGHYSQWGETEKDAQELVLKECSKKSGLLICKRDKIKCKEDK